MMEIFVLILNELDGVLQTVKYSKRINEPLISDIPYVIDCQSLVFAILAYLLQENLQIVTRCISNDSNIEDLLKVFISLLNILALNLQRVKSSSETIESVAENVEESDKDKLSSSALALIRPTEVQVQSTLLAEDALIHSSPSSPSSPMYKVTLSIYSRYIDSIKNSNNCLAHMKQAIEDLANVLESIILCPNRTRYSEATLHLAMDLFHLLQQVIEYHLTLLYDDRAVLENLENIIHSRSSCVMVGLLRGLCQSDMLVMYLQILLLHHSSSSKESNVTIDGIGLSDILYLIKQVNSSLEKRNKSEDTIQQLHPSDKYLDMLSDELMKLIVSLVETYLRLDNVHPDDYCSIATIVIDGLRIELTYIEELIEKKIDNSKLIIYLKKCYVSTCIGILNRLSLHDSIANNFAIYGIKLLKIYQRYQIHDSKVYSHFINEQFEFLVRYFAKMMFNSIVATSRDDDNTSLQLSQTKFRYEELLIPIVLESIPTPDIVSVSQMFPIVSSFANVFYSKTHAMDIHPNIATVEFFEIIVNLESIHLLQYFTFYFNCLSCPVNVHFSVETFFSKLHLQEKSHIQYPNTSNRLYLHDVVKLLYPLVVKASKLSMKLSRGDASEYQALHQIHQLASSYLVILSNFIDSSFALSEHLVDSGNLWNEIIQLCLTKLKQQLASNVYECKSIVFDTLQIVLLISKRLGQVEVIQMLEAAQSLQGYLESILVDIFDYEEALYKVHSNENAIPVGFQYCYPNSSPKMFHSIVNPFGNFQVGFMFRLNAIIPCDHTRVFHLLSRVPEHVISSMNHHQLLDYDIDIEAFPRVFLLIDEVDVATIAVSYRNIGEIKVVVSIEETMRLVISRHGSVENGVEIDVFVNSSPVGSLKDTSKVCEDQSHNLFVGSYPNALDIGVSFQMDDLTWDVSKTDILLPPKQIHHLVPLRIRSQLYLRLLELQSVVYDLLNDGLFPQSRQPTNDVIDIHGLVDVLKRSIVTSFNQADCVLSFIATLLEVQKSCEEVASDLKNFLTNLVVLTLEKETSTESHSSLILWKKICNIYSLRLQKTKCSLNELSCRVFISIFESEDYLIDFPSLLKKVIKLIKLSDDIKFNYESILLPCGSSLFEVESPLSQSIGKVDSKSHMILFTSIAKLSSICGKDKETNEYVINDVSGFHQRISHTLLSDKETFYENEVMVHKRDVSLSNSMLQRKLVVFPCDQSHDASTSSIRSSLMEFDLDSSVDKVKMLFHKMLLGGNLVDSEQVAFLSSIHSSLRDMAVKACTNEGLEDIDQDKILSLSSIATLDVSHIAEKILEKKLWLHQDLIDVIDRVKDLNCLEIMENIVDFNWVVHLKNCSGIQKQDNNTSSSLIEVLDGDVHIDGNKVKALSQFPTFKAANVSLSPRTGRWYYEVYMITDGLVQIGYADEYFKCDTIHGQGVGDHYHSWAFDGYRCKKWNISCTNYGKRWKKGDVIGCLMDMDLMELRFSLNGEDLGSAFTSFANMNDFTAESSFNCFFPVISLNNRQAIRYNFGQQAFRYPPNLIDGFTFKRIIEAIHIKSDYENVLSSTLKLLQQNVSLSKEIDDASNINNDAHDDELEEVRAFQSNVFR